MGHYHCYGKVETITDRAKMIVLLSGQIGHCHCQCKWDTIIIRAKWILLLKGHK